MTDLTGNKDVDLLIFENLDDRSLFQYCEIGKKDPYVQKLCNDEHFWLKRLQKTFGNVEKRENRKWKSLYLSLVYFTDKYQKILLKIASDDEVRNFVHELAIKDDFDVLNYFIQKGFNLWNTALEVAVLSQNVDMVKYFMRFAKIYWNLFARLAIQVGNIEILKLALPHVHLQDLIKGEGFSYLFRPAAEEGKLDFLKYILRFLKIKEQDLLFLIESFSLPREGFKIPVEQAKNIFTFLADTYLSRDGRRKKLKKAIDAILYEDVKDEEYTNFLKKYKKNL